MFLRNEPHNSFSCFRRFGLSELLSALILLSVSIAVAFILVYALPTVSPPESKPWLRPTLITAFREDLSVKIYLYNPHSESVKVLEAWSGGESRDIGVTISLGNMRWLTRRFHPPLLRSSSALTAAPGWK